MIDISKEIHVKVSTHFPKNAKEKLTENLRTIQTKEYEKLKDASAIIVQLYLQIGSPEYKDQSVFDYRNKNDASICIQPKIKTYMIFHSSKACLEYVKEELTENDLYFALKVVDGKITEETLH
jgi:hypothetical protein